MDNKPWSWGWYKFGGLREYMKELMLRAQKNAQSAEISATQAALSANQAKGQI